MDGLGAATLPSLPPASSVIPPDGEGGPGHGTQSSSFTGFELRVLREIIRDAYSRHASSDALSSPIGWGGDGERPGGEGGRVGSELQLLTVLKSYSSVLARHGIPSSNDTFFYKTILELSLRPEGDWWHRLDAEAAKRSSLGPRAGGSGHLTAHSSAFVSMAV